MNFPMAGIIGPQAGKKLSAYLVFLLARVVWIFQQIGLFSSVVRQIFYNLRSKVCFLLFGSCSLFPLEGSLLRLSSAGSSLKSANLSRGSLIDFIGSICGSFPIKVLSAFVMFSTIWMNVCISCGERNTKTHSVFFLEGRPAQMGGYFCRRRYAHRDRPQSLVC